MKRTVIDFLEDILAAIDDIERFTQGHDFDSFQTDKKTIYAVTHAIEIMGEATKNIPDPLRITYPQVPWKQIAGMRDKLIHGYFSVNLLTLWKAATIDASQIKMLISSVKEAIEAGE